MKKKIYIAGKITGDPSFKEKFGDVKNHFEELGYIVLNPAELPQGMTPGDYMKICFAMIDVADEVYFMPCYADSLGARLELQYCEYINKRTRFQILPLQYGGGYLGSEWRKIEHK